MADRTIIKLQDGPGNGQEYYEEDFVERIRAAQRMGRSVPEQPGGRSATSARPKPKAASGSGEA